MTVQPNVQLNGSAAAQPDTRVRPDVRTQIDEYHRDVVGAETLPVKNRGAASVVADTEIKTSAVDNLLRLLEKSAQTLRHTAENVEARGLKLRLKVMAQERAAMYNSLGQALGRSEVDPLDPSRKPTGRSLQEGMEDIQTSMTVQRQGRENVALGYLLSEEDALLSAYSDVLAGDVAGENGASSLRRLLEEQRSQIAKFDSRLQGADVGIPPIVARVYDIRSEGENAVKRLQAQGFTASEIDAASINRVTKPVLQTTAVPPSPRNTIIAGATGGAIVGGLVGGALAIFVSMSPQLIGWVTVGPWVLFLGAALIGAGFGSVFGFFIGQSQREDDLMVTVDGLVNGEYLVAVYPQPDRIELAEEVLEIYHARELNR